jgi:cephalosporin hydroxylase
VNLRDVFDKHRCDKGSWHRYDRIYEPLFSPLRDKPIRLLEIGVLKGASVKAWLEYFPQAHVVAVDTFMRVPAEAVAVLLNPRVSWYRCDSTLTAPKVEPVDIIIDDGCHSAKAQLATFKNYSPLLKAGGMYFIEDVKDFKEFGGLPARHHDTKQQPDSKLIEIRS